MSRGKILVWVWFVGMATTGNVFGQSFTTGNLVVLRVGDGTNALSANGSAVSLLEFTTTRSSQSATTVTAIPSSGASALTLNGNSTTEGVLQLSQNGQYLTFGGYRADALGGGPANAQAKVIARVDVSRTVDTSTSVTAASLGGSGSSIRSVASLDGTSYYLGGEGSGSAVGVALVNHGVSNGTATGIFTGNMRQVKVENNQLYISSGATSGAAANFARGVGRSNVALPTSTQTAADVTALFSPAAGSTHQFIFLDRDAGVAGVDTVYAADLTGGQIDKYSFDGSAWTARGSLSVSGVNGIAATVIPSTGGAYLYYTTASEFRSLIDSSAFNADITLFAGSDVLIASAGLNNAFRSIAFTPVPEPLSAFGAGMGLVGVIGWFRRRSRIV